MTREEWLQASVESVRPLFDILAHPLPDRIRVTCGNPSRNARSAKARAIGEHFSPRLSEDSTHEISISPTVDDPYEVFGILLHELSHAATDGDGHKGRFPRLVQKLKLRGKPTATFIDDDFRTEYKLIIDSIGAYPHARLNIGTAKKPQGTRLLAAQCPSCGYLVRITSKWASVALPRCPNPNDQTPAILILK
jgi:hypothetical protein